MDIRHRLEHTSCKTLFLIGETSLFCSVQGLNVYTFILAVCGNVTYAGSIFIYSAHLCFLHKNLPWIVGSTGTLGLDFFIFYQFYIYGAEEEKQGKEEEADKLRIN